MKNRAKVKAKIEKARLENKHADIRAERRMGHWIEAEKKVEHKERVTREPMTEWREREMVIMATE